MKVKTRKLFFAVFVFPIISFVGLACGEDKIERKMYNPWEAEIGYSQVVKAGNTVYVSGIARTYTRRASRRSLFTYSKYTQR